MTNNMNSDLLPEYITLKERVAINAASGRWSKIGAIGERIFCRVYVSLGRNIMSLHNAGADYIVDGKQRLDVKTRTLLKSDDASLISKVPKTQRMRDTVYAYVAFFSSNIRIYVEDDTHSLDEIRSMTWEEAENLHGASSIKNLATNTDSNREHIRDVKSALTIWLQSHLAHHPKIIYRSNKLAQDSMEQRGWGADNFEQREFAASNPQGIVILMFFDSCDVYKLYAYPASEIDNIDWKSKPVGPNLSNSSGFDPRTLPERYKFIGIADFKENAKKRFGLLSTSLA